MADVWLGVPQDEGAADDVLDPYTSRIGGKAMHFCVAKKCEVTCFECPKCFSGAHVSLIAQLYAPMSFYDRFIYVLTCSACTAKSAKHAAAKDGSFCGRAPIGGTPDVVSSCFAVRGQNFNCAYFSEIVEQRESVKAAAGRRERKGSGDLAFARDDGLLFDEAENWGTDDGEGERCRDEGAPVTPCRLAGDDGMLDERGEVCGDEAREAYRECGRGLGIDMGGIVYTRGIALDLFTEPTQSAEAQADSEDALRQLQLRYKDSIAIDSASVETDTESLPARCVRKYLECIGRNPAQCIRWHPGGQPLRSSMQNIVVPPCKSCGAPRQFELQVAAPAVYFLTRGDGERRNKSLHFSNVHVYTCSAHCYLTGRPYVREFVAVESEI